MTEIPDHIRRRAEKARQQAAIAAGRAVAETVVDAAVSLAADLPRHIDGLLNGTAQSRPLEDPEPEVSDPILRSDQTASVTIKIVGTPDQIGEINLKFFQKLQKKLPDGVDYWWDIKP